MVAELARFIFCQGWPGYCFFLGRFHNFIISSNQLLRLIDTAENEIIRLLNPIIKTPTKVPFKMDLYNVNRDKVAESNVIVKKDFIIAAIIHCKLQHFPSEWSHFIRYQPSTKRKGNCSCTRRCSKYGSRIRRDKGLIDSDTLTQARCLMERAQPIP